jgi:hexosaminidase
LEATAFTEHMRTDARLQTMIFPRLIAVAENGWTPTDRRDWQSFAARLPAATARLDALGVGYDAAPFEPQASLARDGTSDRVALANGLDLGQIRYTLDGKAPTLASPLYDGPIRAPVAARLRAATFLDGKPLGRARSYSPSALATTRVSQQLELCSNGINLSLEDDAPRDGQRAVFAVDLMNPCWIWRGADLSSGLALTARVGQVPFNFQIGADRAKIRLRPPATPQGELEVRVDSCAGEKIAVLPLGDAGRRPGLSTLTATIQRRGGRHDLCFGFTATSVDPTWVIDQVTLLPLAR